MEECNVQMNVAEDLALSVEHEGTVAAAEPGSQRGPSPVWGFVTQPGAV